MLITIKNKITRPFRRFQKDNQGVAAIEFAYIAPLLIVLWLGTIELSLALTIDRKVSRIASTVADLLTQIEVIDEQGVTDILEISEDIMFPYNADPNIVVSGVLIENGTARVVWSRTNSGLAHSVGTIFTVPDQIRIDGSFLVVAEVSAEHDPLVGIISFDNLFGATQHQGWTLSDRLFLRPRKDRVCIETNFGDCNT